MERDTQENVDLFHCCCYFGEMEYAKPNCKVKMVATVDISHELRATIKNYNSQ